MCALLFATLIGYDTVPSASIKLFKKKLDGEVVNFYGLIELKLTIFRFNSIKIIFLLLIGIASIVKHYNMKLNYTNTPSQSMPLKLQKLITYKSPFKANNKIKS